MDQIVTTGRGDTFCYLVSCCECPTTPNGRPSCRGSSPGGLVTPARVMVWRSRFQGWTPRVSESGPKCGLHALHNGKKPGWLSRCSQTPKQTRGQCQGKPTHHPCHLAGKVQGSSGTFVVTQAALEVPGVKDQRGRESRDKAGGRWSPDSPEGRKGAAPHYRVLIYTFSNLESRDALLS